MVQERSRSVKSIFAVQRRSPPSYSYDSGALLFDSSTYIGQATTTGNTLQNYQFRIGGRYSH